MEDKYQSLSQYLSSVGHKFCKENTIALWVNLGIRPAPGIQHTPYGWVVIVGPFKKRMEAVKVAFELIQKWEEYDEEK